MAFHAGLHAYEVAQSLEPSEDYPLGLWSIALNGASPEEATETLSELVSNEVSESYVSTVSSLNFDSISLPPVGHMSVGPRMVLLSSQLHRKY